MRLDKVLAIASICFSMLLGSQLVVADYAKGWNAYKKGDFKTALAQWTPLAKQGSAAAQNNLGAMYNNGKGTTENDVTALKWFNLAAEQGHAMAQYNLGSMLSKGEGAQKNNKTAVMEIY